jgi:hypothetical protein
VANTRTAVFLAFLFVTLSPWLQRCAKALLRNFASNVRH